MKSWPVYFFAQILTFMLLFPGKQCILLQNKNALSEVEWRWYRRALFFSAVPLFIVLALRYKVGTDYNSYSRAYATIARFGFFESVPPGYTAWLGNGFVYFCKVIALFFGKNVIWYHATLAAVSLLFLYMAIFKNSKMPLLSLFIYLCDGYYYQLFNQSRQGLAILIIFFSYKFIFENRFIPFSLTVLTASSIHPSALLFFPAFFLVKKKFNIKILLLALATGFILVNNWSLVEKIVSLTRYAGYMDSLRFNNVVGVEVTILWVIYRGGIFGFCLCFRKAVLQKYPQVNCLYVLCAISLILQMMSLRSYIFARTVLYYYIGMLLLIPYIVASLRKKDQVIMIAFLIAIFMIAHIYYFTAKADGMLAPIYQTVLEK
jgi:hypothetical protein